MQQTPRLATCNILHATSSMLQKSRRMQQRLLAWVESCQLCAAGFTLSVARCLFHAAGFTLSVARCLLHPKPLRRPRHDCAALQMARAEGVDERPHQGRQVYRVPVCIKSTRSTLMYWTDPLTERLLSSRLRHSRVSHRVRRAPFRTPCDSAPLHRRGLPRPNRVRPLAEGGTQFARTRPDRPRRLHRARWPVHDVVLEHLEQR